MQKIKRPLLALSALLLCAQLSMDSDDKSISGGGLKPDVNFTGVIQDNTGKKFKASNITISGLYKQIPMYQKPTDIQDSSYNPSINMIRLDLAEVSKIEVPHPDDIHIFQDRKYMIIEVYSKNAAQTKNVYLIENSKKVLCREINSSGPIERELGFAAIQIMTITGYARPTPEETTQSKKHHAMPTPKAGKSIVKYKPTKSNDLKLPRGKH